jgi:hypothetical protein
MWFVFVLREWTQCEEIEEFSRTRMKSSMFAVKLNSKPEVQLDSSKLEWKFRRINMKSSTKLSSSFQQNPAEHFSSSHSNIHKSVPWLCSVFVGSLIDCAFRMNFSLTFGLLWQGFAEAVQWHFTAVLD